MKCSLSIYLFSLTYIAMAVSTAQESRQAGGGDTYNITIPASSIKEFEDIIRIVKNRRRVRRMEGES